MTTGGPSISSEARKPSTWGSQRRFGLAHNKHCEAITFANLPVRPCNADKGFKACTMCASMGLHTQLSTTAFGTVFLMRYPICENARCVPDIGGLDWLKALASVFHRPRRDPPETKQLRTEAICWSLYRKIDGSRSVRPWLGKRKDPPARAGLLAGRQVLDG
jgi:hypothetical protein